MYEQGEYLGTGMGWAVNGKNRERNSVHIVGPKAGLDGRTERRYLAFMV